MSAPYVALVDAGPMGSRSSQSPVRSKGAPWTDFQTIRRPGSACVPEGMDELFSDSDPKRAERAMKCMLQMRKLDIAELRRAADGVPAA